MKIKFLKDFMATQSDDFRDLHAILIKRGDIVDVDGCKYNDSYFDMPKEQAQWLIDNGFAEEVKESGWWKPKYNEEYFYIGHDGSVHPCLWANDPLDNGRLKLGLIFKTEEATKRWRDYLKAIATVRQDEGVLTPEQATKNGYVYYIRSHAVSGLGVHGFNADYISVNTLSFDTSEHADTSLDKHPGEWKIIANYDWSRE